MYKILFFLLVFPFCLFAQVSNDNVENRISLELNKAHTSFTDSCTLQMKCVNTEITDQCIKYHNDQWFEFAPTKNQPYYINISNQNCRDVLGVQLVIVDGKPCEPDSHKLITCASLGNQDDVYVQLDSLVPNKNYLLVLDGYLHDYCKFNIEFSDKAKGFPVNKAEAKENFYSHQNKNIITFNWKVNVSMCDNYEKYLIYRRHQSEKKSTIIRELEHQKTSIGENILDYNSSDTLLKKGKYKYKIMAFKNDSTLELIEQFSRNLKQDIDGRKYSSQFLTIQKTYKKRTPITIMVEDVANEKIIYYEELQPSQEHYKRLHLGEFLAKNITIFRVTIQNGKTLKKESTLYDWSDYLVK